MPVTRYYTDIVYIIPFVDAPVNQYIDNIKEEYITGEFITCSAEGHPDPTIYWLNDNTGDILDNSIQL